MFFLKNSYLREKSGSKNGRLQDLLLLLHPHATGLHHLLPHLRSSRSHPPPSADAVGYNFHAVEKGLSQEPDPLRTSDRAEIFARKCLVSSRLRLE